MSYDIQPGRYKNTNTGIEFDLYVGEDEVIIERETLEIRKDAGEFWFNIEIGNYERITDD